MYPPPPPFLLVTDLLDNQLKKYDFCVVQLPLLKTTKTTTHYLKNNSTPTTVDKTEVQVDENEPLQAGSPHSMLNAVLGSVMCRRNLMLNHCARKYSIQNLVNRSFFTLQLFQFHYENDFSVACK